MSMNRLHGCAGTEPCLTCVKGRAQLLLPARKTAPDPTSRQPNYFFRLK
jgi:hypothetical protein